MLAIAYDRGAASAAEIATALASHTPLAFLVPGGDYIDWVRPVLAELGQVVPLTGGDEDVDRVRELAPDGIVTYSEDMLRDTARLTTALGLPGHSVETIRLLTDKFDQRERLARAGVDSVRHHVIATAADWPAALRAVGLPAIVKPLYGGGSRDTYLVPDEETAMRLAGTLPDGMVLEEFLVGRPSLPYGDFVSVESLCSAGTITHVAVTGKFPMMPPFRELGHIWPAALPPGELAEVTDLVTRALRALEVTSGVTHTEVKLTADGPRIIEVNGRLGGLVNELSRRAAGLDLVRVAGLRALGEDAWAEPVDPVRVFFQYWGAGPTERCQLVKTHGVKAARRVKGITGYRPMIRPGQYLPGGVMTCRMDMVCGDAEDHPAMFAALDEALAHLTYEFSFDNGETVSQAPPRTWELR
jgi:hypothetical protein